MAGSQTVGDCCQLRQSLCKWQPPKGFRKAYTADRAVRESAWFRLKSPPAGSLKSGLSNPAADRYGSGRPDGLFRYAALLGHPADGNTARFRFRCTR